MNLSKRIEQELSGFILFAGMMTPALRRQTAEMVFRFLFEGDYEARKILKRSRVEAKSPIWYQILWQLFGQEKLRDISRNNEDLSFSLARDTLDWAKRTYAQFESSHDQVEAEQELEAFEKRLSSLSLEEWEARLKVLREQFPEHKRAWKFYRKALADGIIGTDEQERVRRAEQDVLKRRIISDWRGFIGREKSEQEAVYLEKAFDKYFKDLSVKVDQLHDLGDLLSPYYNFLGMAWNDTLGNWSQINWSDLESWAESLKRDRSLRELANLLGRWQRIRSRQQEQRRLKKVPYRQWKPNPYGKSEIVGIHHSDDLSRMLPSEVALLSTPEMEILLSQKYVEKKLLTFRYRAMDSHPVFKEEEEELPSPKTEEAGPFVLAIDTSGSMFGAPERIAKALSLAILEIALKQERRVFLISFSTGYETLEVTDAARDFGKFVAFLRMSFHGGTDIEPTLEKALEVLEQPDYQNGDMLIVSDFVVPRLSRKTYDKVQTLRREGDHHFHSLHITRRHDGRHAPLPIFDQHWVYDLDKPGVMRQTIDRLEVIAEG